MGHEHGSETFGEPKTTNYCLACGSSPDSHLHTTGKCNYVDPRDLNNWPKRAHKVRMIPDDKAEISQTVTVGDAAVNHPAHYGGKDNPYEAIKVIEAWDLGFNLGNTIKYISRAGKKGDVVEDLKKAAWYLQREIERRSR